MRAIAMALGLAACGPSIVVQDDDAGGSTGGAATSDAETSPSVPPEMTTAPGPMPVTGGVDDGADDSGTDVDGMDDATDFDDGPPCKFDCFDFGGAFECDLFAQDCPMGEKCMPWANDGSPVWNATLCTPSTGDPALVGEPCQVEGSGITGFDDCGLGLMCWNVDANNVGVCEDFCENSPDNPICEDPDDQCALTNGGALALCLPSCHPLLQDCATMTDVCSVVGDMWICVPDGSLGTGGFGDPCDFINACDPGFACVGAGSIIAPPGVEPPKSCDDAAGCCTAVCEVGAVGDAQCAALDPMSTCVPFYPVGQEPPGYADVGTCMGG